MARPARLAPLLAAAVAVHLAGLAGLQVTAADTTTPVEGTSPTADVAAVAATAAGSVVATDVAAAVAVPAPAAPHVEAVPVATPPPPTVAPAGAPAVPPAPAPAPAPVPAPAPAPAPAPEPQPAAAAEAPQDPMERIRAAYADAVPAGWQADFGVELQLVEGWTSYATAPRLIRIGRGHAEASWSMLLSVVAHEFGHLIAFRYGSQEYVGAAPTGWPDPGFSDPAESWADCVAQAFTGVVDPSYDLPPCPPSALDWTADWLAAGPP